MPKAKNVREYEGRKWEHTAHDLDRVFERGGLDKVGALLDIPASLEVFAILPFGYPARAVGKGKKQRKPLREMAHLERYGRPFE